MSHHHPGLGVLLAILGAAALLSACSTATKRRWLEFFFDDLPPENAVAAAEPATAVTDTNLPDAYARARAAPALVVHKPYSERQCGSCHESAFSQKLRGEVGEICLLCHKTLFGQAPFRHAPAESGFCLGCHNPHESPEKFLLLSAGQGLCRDCHEAKDVDRVAAHARMGQSACQTCHAPHAATNRFLLKPPATATAATTAAPVTP
jgi:predicted CXXCH cytochrome family protein